MSRLEALFNISPDIRYVALYRSGALEQAQRAGLSGASAAESDRYEELFINPALLTLARQRGELDCGGARFVVVGYGNFHQLVIALQDGHASLCFELGSNPLDHVASVQALLQD